MHPENLKTLGSRDLKALGGVSFNVPHHGTVDTAEFNAPVPCDVKQPLLDEANARLTTIATVLLDLRDMARFFVDSVTGPEQPANQARADARRQILGVAATEATEGGAVAFNGRGDELRVRLSSVERQCEMLKMELSRLRHI